MPICPTPFNTLLKKNVIQKPRCYQRAGSDDIYQTGPSLCNASLTSGTVGVFSIIEGGGTIQIPPQLNKIVQSLRMWLGCVDDVSSKLTQNAYYVNV